MIDLTRVLNSIGKSIFVNYYYGFKSHTSGNDLAQTLLEENPRAKSLQAQQTRVSKAKQIFNAQLEKEALKIIIASKRLDAHTIKKAYEILKTFN